MARVCVLTLDPAAIGGVQARLASFLRYAESRGHRCDVFYPATGAPHAVGREAFGDLRSVGEWRPVPVPELLPHFGRMRAFAQRCRLDDGYDAYQLIAGSLSLGLPLLGVRQPFVAWITGSFSEEVQAMPRRKLRHYYLYNPLTRGWMRRQEARVAAAARLVLAVSSYSADSLRSELNVPAERLRVLPGPVDTERFRPGVPQTEPRRYILTVSRLHRGKGLHMLLRSFRKLADRLPDVELRIVGGGPEEERLKELTARLDLNDRVVFTGVKRGEELIAEYRGASLFVLASRRETLGIVLLEAQAAAVPVVTTNCGGSKEAIVSGCTGLMVPVGDERGLAEAMHRVLEDPCLARNLSRAGRERVEREFNEAAVFRRLDRIWDEVLGA